MEKHAALDVLFETGLRHLYHGEQAISENLATLVDHADSSHLQDLFVLHKAETEKQIQRLEKIFSFLNIDPKASKIQGGDDQLHVGNLPPQFRHQRILRGAVGLGIVRLAEGDEVLLLLRLRRPAAGREQRRRQHHRQL